MCDATHNKLFGSVWTDINEVRKRVFYMTYDIIILFYQCLYDIMFDV